MAAGDITSLPKWAQREFSKLQYKLSEVESQNEILRGERPKSRVQVGFDDVYLPDKRSIYFRVGEGDADKIGVVIREGMLSINGYGGAIAIHPEATNSAKIELLRR